MKTCKRKTSLGKHIYPGFKNKNKNWDLFFSFFVLTMQSKKEKANGILFIPAFQLAVNYLF